MPTAILRTIVDAQTAKARAQLVAYSDQLSKTATSGTRTIAGFAVSTQTLLFGAGAAVAGFGIKAIKAASDLGESLNKVRVVFKDASDDVVAFAQNASKIGLAQAEALDAAAGFGAMAQAAGLAERASADMSIKLVKLAADMASFNNQDPSEMLDRLRSGLAGEAEPLRRFGIFISEARTKTEAYRLGIAATGATLTDAQKIQARYSIILKDTIKQQGDFARTVGTSLPNQIRVLKAEFTNLAAAVGKVLIPLVLELTRDLNNLLGPLAKAVDQITELTEKIPILKEVIRGGVFGPLGMFPTADDDTKKAAAYLDAQQELEKSGTDLALTTGQLGESLSKTFKIDAAIQEAMQRQEGLKEAIRITEALAAAHRQAAEDARVQLLAENELAGGLLGIVSAANDLKAAQKDLNDLRKEGKKNTQDYRDAELRVLQAQLALSSQVNELVGQVKSGNVSMAEAKQRLRDVADQAGLTAGETDKLIGTLSSLIGKYKAVPPKVKTDVVVIGANEAIDEIHRVRTALTLLGGSSATVFIRSQTGGVTPAQHGFHGTVTGPRMFYVEPGIRERVDIGPSGTGSSSITVPINIYGDIHGIEDFKQKVESIVVAAFSKAGRK